MIETVGFWMTIAGTCLFLVGVVLMLAGTTM